IATAASRRRATVGRRQLGFRRADQDLLAQADGQGVERRRSVRLRHGALITRVLNREEIHMAENDQTFTDSKDLDDLLGEGSTGRPANTAKRDEAHKLVDYWLNKATGTKWPRLTKWRVTRGLHSRINNPDNIYHHSTNLCGVASFARELAWDDPVQYALLGALLYEGGWGNLGKRSLTRVESSVATRLEKPPS